MPKSERVFERKVRQSFCFLERKKAYLVQEKEGVFIGQAKETTSTYTSKDVKVVPLVPFAPVLSTPLLQMHSF